MQPVFNSPFFAENEGSTLPSKPECDSFTLPDPSQPLKKDEILCQGAEKLEELEKQGYKIPPRLKKCINWFKKVFAALEKSASLIAKGVGFAMKYLGLIFLVVGAIHVFIVLFTTPPSATLAAGLIVIVTAMVTRGAIPVLLAGGSLFLFGSSLLKGETPTLHQFLNGFPIISYFMNLIPSNYSPVDPHQQV